MNNDNAAQQDNAGKPQPFDINKVKIGDEVWFLGGTRTAGRIVDIDLKAGYNALVVRWATGTVSNYSVEGRPFSGAGIFLALPPLDPLDEIDPSPGNIDKLTRRQVGEGYRIASHDEAAPGTEDMWLSNSRRWTSRTFGGNRYCEGTTYRVPIAPAMVPLDQSDIVLGRTIVRAKGGRGESLVVAKCHEGIRFVGTFTFGKHIAWDELRDCYDISFDHGVTWQKAEKKGGQAR